MRGFDSSSFLSGAKNTHSFMKGVIKMKTFAGIIGILLLIPIAVVIVALIVVTLIGGYIGMVLSMLWEVAIAIVAIIIVYKIIAYFIRRKG
jgi:hypothetical protein